MSDRGLHYIAADLADSWVVDWSGVGLDELEHYLSKVAAFERFLLERDGDSGAAPRAV